MVVDPAVVGLSRQRGIGDHGRSRPQAGLRGVGGQQGRAQRRLVQLAAALIQPQQRLGPARHAGHGVDIREVRLAIMVVRANRIDLDRRVLGPQIAIRDKAFHSPGPDGVAELCHFDQPRGPFDGVVYQDGPGGPRGVGIEIIAHHQIGDALLPEGVRQSVRRPARGEQLLYRIDSPDGFRGRQRDGIADSPWGLPQCLQRLVAGKPPGLDGERGARHHECASTGVMIGQPVRRIVPVSGDGVEAAAGYQAAGPGQ
ncbi:Uncharacterised protein [Mycobacteroides abscessus subsp. abscessus]|nr:Uncharacterised protein [Mycobacteroides abscessus subsp. abscessus]